MWRAHLTGMATAARFAPLLAASLAGCAGSPTLSVFGSFFPSWMLCAFAGLILTIVTHRVLTTSGLDKAIPAPLLVYVSLTAAFTFATWLLWLA